MTSPEKIDTLETVFAFPKPIPIVLKELIAVVGVTQIVLSEVANLDRVGLSRVLHGKVKPSETTLGKLREAFVYKFGIPGDMLTLEYLVKCRDIDPAHGLSPRVTSLNTWLDEQPDAIQQYFWTNVDTFIRTVEDVRHSV